MTDHPPFDIVVGGSGPAGVCAAIMMSHINGYARPGLHDARPVDLFEDEFGERIRLQLGIQKIPSAQIGLHPKLRTQGGGGL